MATRQELVDAVKTFANEHYNEDGWDVVVECFDDSDVWEEITGYGQTPNPRSIPQAIARVRASCLLRKSVYEDRSAS